MHWFGKSKKKTAEAPKDSILQMRNTLEMLEKKEKHLDSKIATEIATARANATGNKQGTYIMIILHSYHHFSFSGHDGFEEEEDVRATTGELEGRQVQLGESSVGY